LGNDWQKPYKKSARVVGDVIGKYHPHGDLAVYDAIVRMAQHFRMRYIVIDGQGNFGSVDGDAPAAMRYTEVRMSRFASSLLLDLDKETVDFSPNYDESEMIPDVLPAQIPNLLVNGSSGIAVGMATNIPPHNLTEVINACLALNADPDLPLTELIKHVPGPDFPTAGIIYGRGGIYDALSSGRGRIIMRGRAHIETEPKNNKERIIVTELPYQVNKARLIERIAELVRDKKLEGITALRDESDKQGMRIVVEVRRGDNAEIILNSLYVNTQLQSSFGVNMVALVNGQPKLVNLKELLAAFLAHRREVVTRRTIFELRQALARAHILSGLAIALTNIEAIVQLIKNAADPKAAKQALMATNWVVSATVLAILQQTSIVGHESELSGSGLQGEHYRLSAEQAQSILDMRLQRLTALEQDKIINEYQELQLLIADLQEILAQPQRLLSVINEELLAIKAQFGDQRRTEILNHEGEVQTLDLVVKEDVVVTISHAGYIKTQPLSLYKAQHRGGRGKAATSLKEADFIERLVIASSHDTILCFSNLGRVYWLRVYEMPESTRYGRGRPIVNSLPLENTEKIQAILPVSEYLSDKYVVMATARGLVKKVALQDFSRPRHIGIIAIVLNDGDKLIGVEVSNGSQDVMLFSDAGKVVRFAENKIRCASRKTRGVSGICVQEQQKVVSLVLVGDNDEILTATANGYGNRTKIANYRRTRRGMQGVRAIRVNQRNGAVICAVRVAPDDEIMLISNKGTLVRTPVQEVSLVGRNTQGVRLIKLAADEQLVGLEKVATLQPEIAVTHEELPDNND
jgi:DNA gyrase subunit A